MAGRLGVLRRLVGEGGSWLVVQLDGARAESLRSSSSASSCVRRSADAFGPGEVRGRRTLLSHERDAGLLDVRLARCGCVSGGDVDVVSTVAGPDASASSSLMAVRRSVPS